MRRVIGWCSIVCLLWATLTQAAAQFPPVTTTDNGARLGIGMDTASYTYKNIPVVKVLDVSQKSPLNGIIFPGDFLLQVNGFYLHNSRDVQYIVYPGGPGSQTHIVFLDSRHDLTAKQITINTTSEAALAQQPPALSSTSQSSRQPGLCDSNPFLCFLGGVAATVAVIGVGMSAINAMDSGESGRHCHDEPTVMISDIDGHRFGGPPRRVCD